MMKLEKENILFIDNYLKKEGVNHADIRFEMVDHIASAVEEKIETQKASFDYAFKTYMASHKKEILANNRKYLQLAGKKAFSIVFKNFVKPIFIFLILLIFVLFYGLVVFFPDFDYRDTFQISLYVLMIVLGGTVLYRQFSGKEQFSVADRILGMSFLLTYLPNMIFRVQDKIEVLNLLFVYYSVMLTFPIVVYWSYREIMKRYEDKYQLR